MGGNQAAFLPHLDQLAGHQPFEEAFLIRKRFKRSRLNNPAGIDDINAIGLTYRAETVRRSTVQTKNTELNLEK
jgi:hypothetical protein